MSDEKAKPFTADEVKDAIHSACRMLAIREHSIKQLEVKLANKGYSDAAVIPCLSYLLDEDWLSESRFCNVFIRSKSARGQGLERIVMELNQHGIDQATISEQLAIEAIDWQQNCDDALAKKIRISADNGEKHIEEEQVWETKIRRIKNRKKLQRFLKTRGFSYQEIYVSLQKRFKNI